jgi:hypothetical protein
MGKRFRLSWEDRFGAYLVGVGFADMMLAVQSPPRTLEHAMQIAADHCAMCLDNIYQGVGSIEEYASANSPRGCSGGTQRTLKLARLPEVRTASKWPALDAHKHLSGGRCSLPFTRERDYSVPNISRGIGREAPGGLHHDPIAATAHHHFGTVTLGLSPVYRVKRRPRSLRHAM